MIKHVRMIRAFNKTFEINIFLSAFVKKKKRKKKNNRKLEKNTRANIKTGVSRKLICCFALLPTDCGHRFTRPKNCKVRFLQQILTLCPSISLDQHSSDPKQLRNFQ